MIFTAYGPTGYAVPTSATSMAATSGGYPDYSQMTAASQGIPATAPGSQPRLETPAATDYSAYGEKACMRISLQLSQLSKFPFQVLHWYAWLWV